MFLDALVDDGAHAVAAGLRRHRQGLEPRLCQRVDKLLRHRVGAERGDGHREALAEDVLAERVDLRIVGDRGAHEADALAVLERLLHLFVDDGKRPVARLAEAVARHAEAAVTAAAARRLDEVEVELRIVRDDDRVRRIRVEVVHPLARDGRRRARKRLDGRQMPLVIVTMLVERGHVDARHLRELLQQLVAREPLALGRLVGVHQRGHDDLALADDEGIEDGGERLGVERRARAARDEDGVSLAALSGLCLDLAHREELQDVEVVHLERDGKAQHVEVVERRLRLHAHDRRARIHIALDLRAFRQEDALTGRVTALVQQVVDDVEAEIRHADEVRIGIDEGKTRPRAHGIDVVPLLLLQLLLELLFQFPIQIQIPPLICPACPPFPCLCGSPAVRAACAAACSAVPRGSSRCRRTCGRPRQSGCRRRRRSP